MSPRKKRRLLGIPAGLVAGLLVGALAATPVARRLEALSLDKRLELRGERALDRRVVVVDVNDETLNLLGWPVPRGFYAQLIDVARKHGARAVGFDVLFLEKSPQPAMDELLAKSAKACGCVVFPSQLSPQPDGSWRVESPLPLLDEAGASRAHVQLDNGLDGVFRTVPLELAVTTPGAPPRPYPALAVALAHVAGAPVRILEPDGAKANERVWIDWRAATSQAVHALPLLDVLAAQQALDSGEKPAIDLDATFKDAIVIVGQSAKSVGDRGPVPFSADAPLVLAHANFLDNILNDRLLAPPSTTSALVLAVLLAVLVGAAVTGLRAAASLPISLALLAAWAGACTLAFRADAWLPLVVPSAAALLSFMAASVVNLAARDADEKRLRQAFERYVAPNILDKILERPEDVDIRGHTRTLTLLFSDIKGYTTLSNTLPPDAIVELLCTYLDTMVDILLQHEGTVDKIMGDGIMAFFGDPLPQGDHALRCVKAALDMQRATTELGEKWVERGLSPLQVRIGVATGDVFVGSIGSRQHLEYTAIGRPVNLASRLEGKAPPGGVLVSSETYALIKDQVSAREVRGLDLKGYTGGYDAWLVTGLAGEAAHADVDVEQRRSARRPFFQDVVLVHDGKEIAARSSDISPGGMFVHGDVLPAEGARVKVRAILARATSSPVQMDAVVTHAHGDGAGLMFTSVYADDRAAIQALLEGVLGHEAWDESRITDEQGRFAYAIEPTTTGA